MLEIAIQCFMIILTATTLLVVSARASVKRPKHAMMADATSRLFHFTDLQGEEADDEAEIEGWEVLFIPALSSVGLIGLYYLIKSFGADAISLLIRWYFLIGGSLAELNACMVFLQAMCRLMAFKWKPTQYKLALFRSVSTTATGVVVSSVQFNLVQLCGVIFGLIFLFNQHFIFYDSWLLKNIASGCSVVLTTQVIKLKNFRTGFILLVCLIVYDVYFVFGSDIMVSVATEIKGPLVIEVPRNISQPISGVNPVSILGLGDIAIPALFASIVIRFDVDKFYKSHPSTPFSYSNSVEYHYFAPVVFVYILSLMVTFGINYHYSHGQPAMLYICPALIMTVIIISLKRNEFTDIFKWSCADSEDNSSIGLRNAEVAIGNESQPPKEKVVKSE